MSRKPQQCISIRFFIALACFTLLTEHRATAQTVQATIPLQPVDTFGYSDGKGAIILKIGPSQWALGCYSKSLTSDQLRSSIHAQLRPRLTPIACASRASSGSSLPY